MKVIILQDVPHVGKKHEVKEVADGLARNFLIPKKFAQVATKEAIKNIELVRAKNLIETENRSKEFSATLESLKDKTLIMLAKANKQGNLFAAITEKDIVDIIQKQENRTVEPRQITFKKIIKSVGTHSITIEEGVQKGEIILVVQTEEVVS